MVDETDSKSAGIENALWVRVPPASYWLPASATKQDSASKSELLFTLYVGDVRPHILTTSFIYRVKTYGHKDRAIGARQQTYKKNVE